MLRMFQLPTELSGSFVVGENALLSWPSRHVPTRHDACAAEPRRNIGRAAECGVSGDGEEDGWG